VNELRKRAFSEYEASRHCPDPSASDSLDVRVGRGTRNVPLLLPTTSFHSLFSCGSSSTRSPSTTVSRVHSRNRPVRPCSTCTLGRLHELASPRRRESNTGTSSFAEERIDLVLAIGHVIGDVGSPGRTTFPNVSVLGNFVLESFESPSSYSSRNNDRFSIDIDRYLTWRFSRRVTSAFAASGRTKYFPFHEAR